MHRTFAPSSLTRRDSRILPVTPETPDPGCFNARVCHDGLAHESMLLRLVSFGAPLPQTHLCCKSHEPNSCTTRMLPMSRSWYVALHITHQTLDTSRTPSQPPPPSASAPAHRFAFPFPFALPPLFGPELPFPLLPAPPLALPLAPLDAGLDLLP